MSTKIYYKIFLVWIIQVLMRPSLRSSSKTNVKVFEVWLLIFFIYLLIVRFSSSLNQLSKYIIEQQITSVWKFYFNIRVQNFVWFLSFILNFQSLFCLSSSKNTLFLTFSFLFLLYIDYIDGEQRWMILYFCDSIFGSSLFTIDAKIRILK